MKTKTDYLKWFEVDVVRFGTKPFTSLWISKDNGGGEPVNGQIWNMLVFSTSFTQFEFWSCPHFCQHFMYCVHHTVLQHTCISIHVKIMSMYHHPFSLPRKKCVSLNPTAFVMNNFSMFHEMANTSLYRNYVIISKIWQINVESYLFHHNSYTTFMSTMHKNLWFVVCHIHTN